MYVVQSEYSYDEVIDALTELYNAKKTMNHTMSGGNACDKANNTKKMRLSMTKKQQLEYLLESYMKNEYDIKNFCDEFTRIFFQEVNDEDVINKEERELFNKLARECDRYSPYKEDLLLSKYFVDDKYIDNIIRKTYKLYLSLS